MACRELEDAYAVLEVSRDASAEEIRRAYHRLARQYHPDAASGAADPGAFDRVQQAWEQLRESNAREAHDAGLRVQELRRTNFGTIYYIRCQRPDAPSE